MVTTDLHQEELPFRAETVKDGLKIATQLGNHFLENDSNEERARKFKNELDRCMANYTELHKNLLGPEDQRSSQKLITEFFLENK